MSSIRQKLIDKIKQDCDLYGLEEQLTVDLKIHRPTLTWQHKTAGRMVWYWYINGYLIGSAENMKELLTSKKLELDRSSHGDYELSSS
jgi:hypothetical protein